MADDQAAEAPLVQQQQNSKQPQKQPQEQQQPVQEKKIAAELIDIMSGSSIQLLKDNNLVFAVTNTVCLLFFFSID